MSFINIDVVWYFTGILPVAQSRTIFPTDDLLRIDFSASLCNYLIQFLQSLLDFERLILDLIVLAHQHIVIRATNNVQPRIDVCNCKVLLTAKDDAIQEAHLIL